jgi:hypothetical protein
MPAGTSPVTGGAGSVVRRALTVVAAAARSDPGLGCQWQDLTGSALGLGLLRGSFDDHRVAVRVDGSDDLLDSDEVPVLVGH